jgi:hypothetical protein
MSVIYETFSGISQLFFVRDETGIFLTSIDIFFQNKDETAPVTLQIRNVVAGIPGNVTVPFSEVTLDPDQINVSTDATVPTSFVFPSPVYLSGPQQQEVRQSIISNQQAQPYAITLLTNSKNYKVFIAEIGDTSIESVNGNTDANIFSGAPGLGNLFKSQNASTWIPSPLEFLKYKIYRAKFTSEGLVRFFNTQSSVQNGNITVTGPNQFLPLSKKIIVGLGSTGLDSNVSVGASILQNNATATLTSIGSSVISTIINNVGTGYTNGTFTNVNLLSETGFGQGSKATIGIVSSGISTVTITDGGFGYSVGDVLSIGTIGQDIGFGGQLVVQSIGSPNSLELSDVQGQFNVGISTVYFINSSGISSQIGAGSTITSIVEDQYYDGLHMKVYHINHGMHSKENYVQISKFRPNVIDTNSKLSSNLSISDTTVNLESTSGFEVFENLPVSGSNIGYAIVGEEVISYTGISGNSLTGVTRSIDSSPTQPFAVGTFVHKYEFNGISLRRINKVHNFADVDVNNHPIDLDSYFIKLDMTSSGKDRSNDLFFTESVLSGETGTNITQNIQFESFQTKIKNIILTKTNTLSKIRTFTATSVNGNENSFEDSGFVDFNFNNSYYFNSPRLIASSLNEQRFNLPTPGNRSLELDFFMDSQDDRVSPVIDTQDAGIVLTTNRLNNPVDDFATNDRVRSLFSDPNEAIYISKIIDLKLPANAIKVILTAAQDITNDIRVFYRIFRPDVESINYEPFPGYSNYQIGQDGIKRVIDPSLNDGSADFDAIKQTNNDLRDYEYSVDDLPDFMAFSIKIVMCGTNQASPPYLTTLRAIATKKPSP